MSTDAEAQSVTLRRTVFVVDDDEAVRSGIADLIEGMGLNVQTFGSAEEFMIAYNPAMPGCLVLDLAMPGMSGLELQKTFYKKGIQLPIIIITGHGDISASVKAMKLGAVDFLEKPFREQVLSECISKALALDEQNRSKQTEHVQFKANLAALTERERQLMKLMISGKTDKQIALELEITQRAVSFHRLNILNKMGVSSMVELAASAAKSNFFETNPQ